MIDQLSVMVLLLLGLAQLLVSSGQQHSSTITSVQFYFPTGYGWLLAGMQCSSSHSKQAIMRCIHVGS